MVTVRKVDWSMRETTWDTNLVSGEGFSLTESEGEMLPWSSYLSQ